MFVPGVVATAENGETCRQPTSHLVGCHDCVVRKCASLTRNAEGEREKKSAPRAVSCDCRPGRTISSFVLHEECRHLGGRSHPADEHFLGDSHLEKVKRSEVDRW